MKFWKKIFIVFIVLGTLTYFFAGILSEYGNYSKDFYVSKQAYIDKYKSADDSDWKTVSNDAVILENEKYKLNLDSKTTKFIVTDKLNSKQYFSYPNNDLNLVSEEDKIRANSNISLLYYDSASKEHYMGSGPNCVESKQFVIKTKDNNSIRIYYTLGTSNSKIFAPLVFTKDVFENEILPKLSSNSDRRRMKIYYQLYSKNNKPDDYNAVAQKYPAINSQDMYVLINEVTKGILEEITDYVNYSGYTRAKYEATKSALKIVDNGKDIPAGFEIPIEISLNDDGFCTKILTDKIKENNSIDRLAKIYLLEYFGAVDSDAKGFFFVPDGSGALINLNQKEPQNYVQHFYNDDISISKTKQEQLSRNATLPVFGLSSDKGSFFAFVDGAAASATLNVRTKGGANPINSIYSIFDFRGVEQTSIGEDRNIPNLNMYSKHILYEFPQINYVLMSNGKTGISDMAAICKDKYIKNGTLKAQIVEKESLPLYLDFICVSAKKTNFFGIPYDQKIVLSDIKSITEIINRLHSKGITNLQVRLKGWNVNGINSNVLNKYAIDKSIGTEKELYLLAKSLSDKGGRLFLDTDFSFVSKNSSFDAFKISLDASRHLDRSIASLLNFDRVGLDYSAKLGMKYIVSPASYNKFSQNFLSGFTKTTETQNIGLSWSNGGMYLGSDFNSKTDFDMSMTANETARLFDKLKAARNWVMTDYGNSYVLPYVKNIVNVPLTNSSFTSETATVPFYQMVVSNSISVSGPPINMMKNSNDVLDMATSASAPYFLFITSSDNLLKEANLDNLYYSLNYKKSIDKVEEIYSLMSKQLNKVYGEKIVKYEVLAENVTKTAFSNGYSIITNRSSNEYSYNKNKIASNSFALVSES